MVVPNIGFIEIDKPDNGTLSEIMPQYNIKNECPEKQQHQRKSSDIDKLKYT